MTEETETHQGGGVNDGAPDTGNREAAKYRRQLREVELERDELRGALEGARRDLVVSAIRSQKISKSRATELGREDAAEMPTFPQVIAETAIADALPQDLSTLFVDGALDQTKVAEHVYDTYATRPHLFAHSQGSAPVVPAMKGVTHGSEGASKGFTSAFKPRSD